MRTNRNRIEIEDRLIRRYPLQSRDQRDLRLIADRHETARRAGLPVPAVLAVHTGGVSPHLVMERAGGTPLMETRLDETGQVRLGADLAGLLATMRRVRSWLDDHTPAWSTLWSVLADVTDSPECVLAAETASATRTCLVHGDLSAGNLMVSGDGILLAVIDWDGAALADPAMDWAALSANCSAATVAAMRANTPDADELDRRAAIYLDTWPVQHDLWAAGRHPWLSGDVPVAEPRL